MSMNQLSSDKPWWMEMESPSKSSAVVSQNALVDSTIINHEEEEDEDDNKNLPNKQLKNEERESMFEKLLTPSDVGKLNRLVIPKQHAERYFPIGGGGDSGVVLSFEDELGKLWKFRYSYWNSSQSYVLTKGWSRYVKEKRLRAGDTILFQRFRDGGGERFWIGWRPPPPVTQPPGAGGWTPHGVQHPYPPSPLPYQPHCPHAPERAKWSCGAQKQTSAGNSSSSSVNCKTVRLFGVDLECQLDDDDDHGPNHPAAHQPHQYNNNPSTSNHGSHYI